jgi:hypothetical protein
MPPKVKSRSRLVPALIGLTVLLAVAGLGIKFWMNKKPLAAPAAAPVKIPTPVASGSVASGSVASAPVIDYNQLQKDAALKAEMAKRKAQYGVGKGIDIIARGNESVRVGKTTIPLSEIMDQIRLKRGDILENDLSQKTALAPVPETGKDKTLRPLPQVFGIHVVQPGDNIWNIHFAFLRAFFKKRGITVSRVADRPLPSGKSSGVGKILKYAEKMVYIYNIREKRLDVDLNRLQPGTKLVIFNIGQALAVLKNIDYRKINRIQFDGQTLWIPAKP